MQIASQPSADAAKSTYQDLAQRYASVIGGRGVNIVKADIEGKGTYWRVRVPAKSRDEAVSLCTNYKAAGGNCFVSKYASKCLFGRRYSNLRFAFRPRCVRFGV